MASLLKSLIKPRLPVILQMEACECGIASLAMVAIYHGYKTDLCAMRQRFPISRKGASLSNLIQMARMLQLESRPLKLEMEHLEQLNLPCVLHWDMNHFVVLKSVSARKIVVHDPASGPRSYTHAEFAHHFTGIALELRPAADFQPLDDQRHFSLYSLMGRVTGLKRSLVRILILAFALEIIAVLLPFYLQWVIDHVLVSADSELMTVLGLGFIALVCVQTAISFIRGRFVVAMSNSLNFQWLGNVFAHLLKLPLEYFEKRNLGDIMSCFGSVSTIQRTLTMGFLEAIVDGVLVIGTLILMLLYSPALSMIAFLAVALYVLMRWGVYHPLREATAEEIVHEAKQHTHFLETARGVKTIRLFGRTEERRLGWLNILTNQFNAGLRIQHIHISYESTNKLLFGIENVLIVWLAALSVMRNEFTIGMLFAFIAYKDQFTSRVTALVDKLFELRMLRLHGERVADIVLTPAENDLLDRELDLSSIVPALEIRNVHYRYSSIENSVLQGVSLRIAAGECIAITGASGCGKTTLAKIILGLFLPDQGEVCIDGRPIQEIGLMNYRSLIGTVMQDDTLFTGSITDNISFFDPAVDYEWLQTCAVMAAIHDEIIEMPMGYDTLVGDIGTGMSGGQIQRVLLARALYKRPRILVLDEATSNLDVMNERAVNEEIKRMNMTRIIIAHRPETIAMAGRVITLDAGQVVDDPVAPALHLDAVSS